jgi:hypothetical protein
VVENQIAEGDALPVKRIAERLMREGLDRHEAIHAIGSVLVSHLNDLTRQGAAQRVADPNAAYFSALEQLTAQAWLRSG